MQQAVTGQVFRLEQSVRAGEQRRAAGRGEISRNQQAGLRRDFREVPPFDRHMELGVGEIRQLVGVIEAQVEAGVALPEPRQARRQPFHREMGPHGNAEGTGPAHRFQIGQRAPDAGEGVAEVCEQQPPFSGQFDRPPLARQQPQVQGALETADLMADRRLRDIQLAGRTGERLVAGDRFEGAQCVQGGQHGIGLR